MLFVCLEYQCVGGKKKRNSLENFSLEKQILFLKALKTLLIQPEPT